MPLELTWNTPQPPPKKNKPFPGPSLLRRYRQQLVPDWVTHDVFTRCQCRTLDKYVDMAKDLAQAVSVAFHDATSVVQSLPAEHDVLVAQTFDFTVLHRWVPAAEATELARACVAGLSSAAAKIEDAAVKVLAEVARGSRTITGDEGRALQTKLSFASQAPGATQRHLIAVLTVHKPVGEQSDEELLELHGKVAQALEELQKPEEAGQELVPWWRGQAMKDAELQKYLETLLRELSGTLLSRVTAIAKELEKPFIEAFEFVRDLPDMEKEEDSYMLRLAPDKSKNGLSALVCNLRNVISRLDRMKEAVTRCVPKADEVFSVALIATCKGACAEAAKCLCRGTDTAAPWEIEEGSAAYKELLRCAELRHSVLESHIAMGVLLTLDKAGGSGGECKIPKLQEQFTSCLTRARETLKILSKDSRVVVPPGMESRLAKIAHAEQETAPQPQHPFPVFMAPKAKAKAAAKGCRVQRGRR